MYAKIQTHANIVASRKLLVNIVQHMKMSTTKLMVSGHPSKKGATISMIKHGMYDGWLYQIDFKAGTNDVILIKLEPKSNRLLLNGSIAEI